MAADRRHNELDTNALWMPFTANRAFKERPRIIESAAGMVCRADDGRELLDGASGLWCCNAGHCHPKIVEAIREQAGVLDYATTFQLGHPGAFRLAERLAAMAPADLNAIFLVNSGSEAVDTALKIACAYHHARGESARTLLIGRERGYHGVGYGGTSVGGIGKNRRGFGPLLPNVAHLPATHDLARQAFSRGQPAWGGHLADALEHILAVHDPATVAAVIVEPFAGSTGVLPPPQGYLERLREITAAHGILLIFDEVISAFGRLGRAFAAERFAVTPDMITTAKGLTSGSVPMGAVFIRAGVRDAIVANAPDAIELFHGYTYSGHPLAAAAALATLTVYAEERLFENAEALAPVFEDALHALADKPHVRDIRNIGLAGAVELTPRQNPPGSRAAEVVANAWDRGALLRFTGDVVAIAPPLIASERDIAAIADILGAAIDALA